MPAVDGLADWLRLEQAAGVGPETARKLLGVFGLPGNIFDAGLGALKQVVPERVAQALVAQLPANTQTRIEQTLTWAGQSGNHVLTLADAVYPRALLNIADPPILLYVRP